MPPNISSSGGSIQRPETEVIAEYIAEEAIHIHIEGEPGIGKTTTLHQIRTRAQDEFTVDIRNIRPNHSLTDIFNKRLKTGVHLAHWAQKCWNIMHGP